MLKFAENFAAERRRAGKHCKQDQYKLVIPIFSRTVQKGVYLALGQSRFDHAVQINESLQSSR